MAQIIGIIIALIIAISVARDASKRQMNAVAWGIGVFLLLIVFLPLYFIMRKPLQAKNEREEEKEYYEEIIEESGGEGDPVVIEDTCPACGSKLSANDAQCPECGLNLQ
jgi:hypothetical protein